LDILHFLKKRTQFIRQFYESAEQPFRETIRRIEEGEEPYYPPFNEDPEPPFLKEWMAANEALEVLGYTCLSMLSSSLQLYFKTWEHKLGIEYEKGERKRIFKGGMLGGYRCFFEQVLQVSWEDCSIDLALIEQITLARNSHQHPENMRTMLANHGSRDLEKYPHPFFMSEIEKQLFADDGDFAGVDRLRPSIHVPREHLIRAIDETETLVTWLEGHLQVFR